MKVSYSWLQSFIEEPLPAAESIAELLTMHAFEVESVAHAGEDSIFDIKVLPDRSHDCLCHLGIAKEIALLANLTLKDEFLQSNLTVPESNVIRAEIENNKKCRRMSLLVIENVEVKNSPVWLQNRLTSIGQRSVNAIVDATNYVMFSLGQPLHAYDLNALSQSEGGAKLFVRQAKADEKIKTLDDKDYKLNEDDIVIADGGNGNALGIAGIKGGQTSHISAKTKHVVIEAANFDPISIRKTAKILGVRTDASVRFENEITPELTLSALKQVSELIFAIAGTEETKIEGLIDLYPRKPGAFKVGVSLSEIKLLVGVDISESEVQSIFSKITQVAQYINPREKIMNTVSLCIGVPYMHGASVVFDAPRAFDCSSFTAYLYVQAGITIPRMSVDQFVAGTSVSADEALPGDLVFSNSDEGKIFYESIEWMKGTKVPEGVDHVGLYLGDGKVLHATRKASGVVEEKLSESESFKKIIGFRRFILNDEKRFVVTVPPQRLDLRIKEDLIEEIGRVHGYNTLASRSIDFNETTVLVEVKNYYLERIRNIFLAQGFSEIITYVFRAEGETELENPLAFDKKFLRNNIADSLAGALQSNASYTDILGIDQVKIFEIGNVFPKNKEHTSVCFAVLNAKGYKKTKPDEDAQWIIEKLKEITGKEIQYTQKENVYEINVDELIFGLKVLPENLPVEKNKELQFRPFSSYPYIVRDIAVFIPQEESAQMVTEIIREEAGSLFITSKLFDTFEKDFPEGKKVSFAFRVVFQSFERTLTDGEINAIMQKVTERLNAKTGWVVR